MATEHDVEMVPVPRGATSKFIETLRSLGYVVIDPDDPAVVERAARKMADIDGFVEVPAVFYEYARAVLSALADGDTP